MPEMVVHHVPKVALPVVPHTSRIEHQFHHIGPHGLHGYLKVLLISIATSIATNILQCAMYRLSRSTSSNLPNFLALLLSIVAQVTWWSLFKNPALFLNFQRPEKAYKWAVLGALTLTTLPNSLVHYWTLIVALEEVSFKTPDGVILAITAICFWIPLTTFVWWMAWRFLLGTDENGEDYEPTCKNRTPVVRQEERGQGRLVEPYIDVLSIHSLPRMATDGYLAQAYQEQRLTVQRSISHRTPGESAEAQELEKTDLGDAEERDEGSNTTPNTNSNPDATNARRCPTITRFEYMSQNYHGEDSWLSHRTIPLALFICASVLLITLLTLLRGGRQYRFRVPCRALRHKLYLPLGMYLLSFYALTHRFRASLFESFDTSPPPHWKETTSFLSSWLGIRRTFLNLKTGETTTCDPRLRAFPWRAHHQPALIRTPEYIQAYNTTSGSCTSYWGHASRRVKTEIKLSPTLFRLGFTLITVYFMWAEYLEASSFPRVYTKRRGQVQAHTLQDISCIVKMGNLSPVYFHLGYWLSLIASLFAVAYIQSMSEVFITKTWKYVSKRELSGPWPILVIQVFASACVERMSQFFCHGQA